MTTNETTLSQLLKEANISQETLAEITKISQPTISNLVLGKQKNPFFSHLAAVSRAFGMSVYEVFPERFSDINKLIRPGQLFR